MFAPYCIACSLQRWCCFVTEQELEVCRVFKLQIRYFYPFSKILHNSGPLLCSYGEESLHTFLLAVDFSNQSAIT